MSVGLVGRYLAATRLGYLPDTVDDATRTHYQSIYAECAFALGFGTAGLAADFVVIDTADAKVENVVLDDKDVTVYDRALGRDYAELNAFTHGRAAPGQVHRWALRRLSVALLSLGAAWPALCAHHLAERTSRDEPKSQPDKSVPVRRIVDVQEFFVIAHECVHSALHRGSLPLPMVESATRLVENAVTAAESTRTAPTTQDVVAAVVRDEVDAINSGSELFRIDETRERALYAARSQQYPLPNYVGSWVRDRPHLIEELVCDLVATDMALLQFADEMDTLAILEAILLGFDNHGTAESIRDLAWHVTHGTRNPDYSYVLGSRTTVWRTMAPDVWGHRGDIDPDHMRASFARLTDAASSVVGNQVRYTLAADFTARLAKTTTPASLPIDVVVDLVLNPAG